MTIDRAGNDMTFDGYGPQQDQPRHKGHKPGADDGLQQDIRGNEHRHQKCPASNDRRHRLREPCSLTSNNDYRRITGYSNERTENLEKEIGFIESIDQCERCEC